MKKENNVYLEYKKGVDTVIDNIFDNNLNTIEEVSKIFAECIGNGGLVHMYGSGHSRMGVEEMFPRYGSYPGYHPMVELSTAYYNNVVGSNGIRQSMFIENIHGLAEKIVLSNDIRPNDCFLLFTTSGTGNVVVELAEEAKKIGCTVVGIISKKNSEVGVSKHEKGYKLEDVADYIIDNSAPVGDACVKIQNLQSPVGPLSTIGNSFIVNLIKIRVAEILTENGKQPKVITHAHFVGKEKSNEMFEESLKDYEKRLKR